MAAAAAKAPAIRATPEGSGVDAKRMPETLSKFIVPTLVSAPVVMFFL